MSDCCLSPEERSEEHYCQAERDYDAHREELLMSENMTLREIFEYANRQADMAQLRLIKAAHGDETDAVLYDDTYWQTVLDKIRFELWQIVEPPKDK